MTPENAPPVLYALWNDYGGYMLDRCESVLTTDLRHVAEA